MSGLAALFQRTGRPADADAVWTMLTAAAYRGPDGLWLHTAGAAALGYAKLAVTPEEADERQPLVSPRTGCVLIADVRLDNRPDLLGRLPGLPAAASDAELILRAYETWGADVAAHLLGDFAFALWDPRQERLVCGRDTGGRRPLFYRCDRETFAAASEIHQLFQDPAVPIAPNEERIREWLTPGNMFVNAKDTAATFYRGVFALPAGCVLLVDREALRVRRYWELQPPPELRYRTDEEYVEHFRSLFFEAVRARLRSTHPVGALLSGGLDSSSAVCVAQELYRAGRAVDHGFTSFSFVADGLEYDERPLIEDIQAKYGFAAEYVTVTTTAGRLELEPRGFQEAPAVGGRHDELDRVWQSVARSGVRAILVGHTADACLGGSRLVFDSLLRQGRLRELRRHWQAYRRHADESWVTSAALAVAAPLLPLGAQRRLMLLHLQYHLRRLRPLLMPAWMPESLRGALAGRHSALSAQLERARRCSNPAREGAYRLLYPPAATRDPAGWPLAFWDPYADRRLHEFLLAIPPEQQFQPHPETDEFYAGSKRLLRRAMRDILPEPIRTRRSKITFSSAVEHEIERRWSLYEAAFGPAARSCIADYGYVEPAKFWERLREVRAGIDTNRPDVIYVYNMVALETWLRTLAQPRTELIRRSAGWHYAKSPVGAQRSAGAPVGGA